MNVQQPYFPERAKFSKILIEKMFQVQRGETVAITYDSGSDKYTAEALAAATYANGGIPLLLLTPKAEKDGQAGMKDWPSAALTAALCEVNVWIELNTTTILYSDIWEAAMSKNKKLRYLILAESSIHSLLRVFSGFEISHLGRFLNQVRDMLHVCQTVRITSPNGTDVSYQINPNYPLDIDDGDYSKPIFGTAPGYVNIVPKIGSMTGSIVFDNLMNANVYDTDNQVEFIMKNGRIADVVGGIEAEKFKLYLSSFNDDNMYKISHNMLGFNPGVHQLCGEIVEDERIWGGVDFGFGHTSPMDMPPNGQIAASHFDGIVGKTSIYLDDVQIVDNGIVCHYDLKPLAEDLLRDVFDGKSDALNIVSEHV